MDIMIIKRFNIRDRYFKSARVLLIRLIYPIMIAATAPISIVYADSSKEESLPPPESENTPIAFKTSYFGLLINRNFGFKANKGHFSSPRTSWGTQYRFFYKDEWTLALTAEFQGGADVDNRFGANFSMAQETQKIIRVYHPWYLAIGGRVSYHVPVKKIALPYERDQSRDVYTGGALSSGFLYIVNEKTILMLNAHRWTSLSVQKDNGITMALTALFMLR